MSVDNFDTSVKLVLIDEGGNVDDPNDHGGRTSRGITQRTYDAWRRNKDKPTEDIWNATDEEIKSIYQDQYWKPYCDVLPTGLDYLFFDISVNAGRGQAIRQFQKALGVKVDGMFGQVTLSEARSQDTLQLIKRISDVRRAFYRALKQFPRYGKGWLNRVNHSEKAAIGMASNTAFTKPPVTEPSPKTNNVPAKPTLSPSTTVVTSGGLIAILTQFKDELSNLSSYIPNLNYIVLGIVAIGTAYAVYSWWKNNKIAKAM